MFSKFARSDSGATLIEYGIAMLVAITIGGVGLGFLAGQTDANFTTMCDRLVADDRIENRCEE